MVVIVGAAASGWLVQEEATTPGEAPPPASLEKAVADAFSSDKCTTATEAEAKIRVNLVAIGYGDWTISSEAGGPPEGCVSASISTSRRSITFNPALRPEVREALHAASIELIDRCLDRPQANAYVTSVLTALGETDWEIRNDGPIGAPADRFDEVMRHVSRGCYVYSGTGISASGTRTYFVTGARP